MNPEISILARQLKAAPVGMREAIIRRTGSQQGKTFLVCELFEVCDVQLSLLMRIRFCMGRLTASGSTLAAAVCSAIVHRHNNDDVKCCVAAGGLTGVLPYGPQVADHCLLQAGLQPQAKIADAPPTPEQRAALLAVVAGFQEWVASLAAAPPPGYIGFARPGQFLPSAVCRPPCALSRVSEFTSARPASCISFQLPAMAKSGRSRACLSIWLIYKIEISTVLNFII